MAGGVDTPATRLEGLQLDGGWVVEKLIAIGRADAMGQGTGGTFSVAYRVRRGGEVAFLKALDLDSVIKSEEGADFLEIIQRESTAFNQEKSLNDFCAKNKLRQVVSIICHGSVKVERQAHDMVPNVPYMILELADGGDVRGYVRNASATDYVAKFSYLKDVLLGITQLHGQGISHQDLKPSNVMVFESQGAKVGDLGRAAFKGFTQGVYDGWVIAGDYSYAPPEQLYGLTLSEWVDRRERCDLYQFGSLVCFLFFGVTVNAMINDRVSPSISPLYWAPEEGGKSTYAQALPFLQKAFFDGIEDYRKDLPEWAEAKVIDLVVQCSNPDYSERGSRRVLGKKQFLGLGLNRFVSALENLKTEAAKRAAIEARKGVIA